VAISSTISSAIAVKQSGEQSASDLRRATGLAERRSEYGSEQATGLSKVIVTA
jgi:hypothetical protein